jgi:hypothetical protein
MRRALTRLMNHLPEQIFLAPLDQRPWTLSTEAAVSDMDSRQILQFAGSVFTGLASLLPQRIEWKIGDCQEI